MCRIKEHRLGVFENGMLGIFNLTAGTGVVHVFSSDITRARKPETTYLHRYFATERKQTVGTTTALGQINEMPQNVGT